MTEKEHSKNNHGAIQVNSCSVPVPDRHAGGSLFGGSARVPPVVCNDGTSTQFQCASVAEWYANASGTFSRRGPND